MRPWQTHVVAVLGVLGMPWGVVADDEGWHGATPAASCCDMLGEVLAGEPYIRDWNHGWKVVVQPEAVEMLGDALGDQAVSPHLGPTLGECAVLVEGDVEVPGEPAGPGSALKHQRQQLGYDVVTVRMRPEEAAVQRVHARTTAITASPGEIIRFLLELRSQIQQAWRPWGSRSRVHDRPSMQGVPPGHATPVRSIMGDLDQASQELE